MKKHTKWIALGVAIVALAAAGVFGYTRHVREAGWHAQAISSLPARPAQVTFPEFKHRIEAAEDQVRGGDDWREGVATLASLYHANGYMQEASTLYGVLSRADAGNARWTNRLAAIYSLYGQLDQAVLLWKRTVDLDSSYLPAQLNLADALIKMNRAPEAVPLYENVLKAEPKNAYAVAGLAKADIAAGRWIQARDRLENGGALAEVRIGENILVTVYEHLGDSEKAESIRSRAKSTDSYIDIPDPWVDEVSEDCYDVFRLTLDSGAARRKADLPRALRLLEKAVRVNPTYALAQYQMGLLRADMHDLEGSKKALRTAIELDPAFGDSWRNLIDVLKKSGANDEADQVLSEGLSRCPDSPTLHLKNGERLKMAGRTDEALEEFKIVVKLRPSEINGLVNCAMIYFEREQNDVGLATLQKANEIMPEDPLVLSTLTIYWITEKNEPKAREFALRCRAQVRLQKDALLQVYERFQATFGRPPW